MCRSVRFDGYLSCILIDFCSRDGNDPGTLDETYLLRHSNRGADRPTHGPGRGTVWSPVRRWHRHQFGVAYCEKQIENPTKTHLVLVTDLYEGGDVASMLGRAAAIKQSSVNLIVLLALSDSGHPAYEAKNAEAIAGLGCPVLACTPDRFPSMMASALTGKDLRVWVAEEDIPLIRGS